MSIIEHGDGAALSLAVPKPSRFARQCATSATAGPVLADCQSTTPATAPRCHSTLPGWKSRCTSTAGRRGRGAWPISAARSHTRGYRAQPGGR